MPDYFIPLLPGRQYHILSRAIGAEKMFREETNYLFFLSRFQKYIPPVADTYCFCLLPNHFHFLVRIKDETEIKKYFDEVKTGKIYSREIASEFVMKCFSNLLNSYTKTYNRMYKRKGGLFIDYMRRVEITSGAQFAWTAFYIHKNPVHHGYCKKMEIWPWSSFPVMISSEPTTLLRQETLDYFEGIKGFTEYHSQPVALKDTEPSQESQLHKGGGNVIWFRQSLYSDK